MSDKKKTVGLPSSFAIAASPEALEAPVDLGHYVDETAPRARARVATTVDVKPVENQGKPRTYGKRKPVNMSAETLQKLAVILNEVQECSVQADASTSEIMDAAISMLYSARAHFVLGKVPARGRWGTPTADAFRHALASAFADAIVRHRTEAA